MSNAGRSALRRSRKLKLQAPTLRVKTLIAVTAFGSGWAFLEGLAASGFALKVVGAALLAELGLLLLAKKRSALTLAEAGRYAAGARWEKETAKELGRLKRSWLSGGRHWVFHDRKIKNSNANLDHFVLGNGNLFYVDTKRRTKGLTLLGGELCDRGQAISKSKAIKTSKWEAGHLFRAARKVDRDIRCYVVWAVHGEIPPGDWVVDGVYVVDADDLPEFITSFPTSSNANANALAKALDDGFPKA